MMDSHTLVLAGLVSQATFALTLALLAWSDRRSRGMSWLAAACGLQFVWTALQPVWNLQTDTMSQAAGACLPVLLFFCVYMGLRWFVVRRKLHSIGGPLAVSLAMALVLAVNPFSAALAVAIARLAAIVLMGLTILMLVQTRFVALRKTAWVCGAMLGAVILLLACRLPLDLQLATATVAMVRSLRMFSLVCQSLLSFSFVAMFVAEAKRRLHDETRTDPLTGLRNRRAMEEIAMQEVALARRMGHPLTLLMMDIDHFKKLNDTWGHALGDRALRAIGGVLLTVTGADDRVTRMGGEEFAVLLPRCDVQRARCVAERLRATVEGLRLNENDAVASFTVSIGVGDWRDGERGWSEMLRRADVALYRAKRNGRNRVELGESAAEVDVVEGRAGWRPERVQPIDEAKTEMPIGA